MTNIKFLLNKAFARWFRRKTTIKSILAQATNAQKQEIIADYDLIKRLSTQFTKPEMRLILSHLNAPLTLRLKIMLTWPGSTEQVVSLIENASHDEKQKIADKTAILTHIMTSYPDDYKLQIARLLNLLAIQTYTNNPNDDEIGFTSLIVLSQDKLTLSKEVNFVPAGTFVYDKTGFETLRSRIIAATSNYLSHKYKLKIESVHKDQDAYGDGEYPIIVKLAHNPDADYHLILHGQRHGLGHMKKGRGHIYELGQPDETFVPSVFLAHEVAHLILGTNDEYVHPWYPKRVIYRDNSIMGDFYSEGLDKAEIKGRHFKFLLSLLNHWFPKKMVKLVE